MTFKDFKTFNQYLGVNAPISDKIDFGKYDTCKHLRAKSEAVNVDFYRISLKKNISFVDAQQNSISNKTVVFFNSPDNDFSWDLNPHWDGFYLQISKEVINKHRFLFKNFLEYGQHEALFLEEHQLAEINQIFNLLCNHYENENYDFELVLSYSNIIVSLVEKYYKQQFLSRPNEYNQIVRDFQLLLLDYYNMPVNYIPTVSYFAEKLNLSSNYLGDVVKHFTKKTPKDLIHEHIVSVAKKMIAEGTLNNAEIAYQLGFEYPNYFSKLFKKIEKISPTDYRLQHKK